MVREISEKTRIPQHFLSKIFQDLTTTSWVSSKKGKNGGFVFAADSRKLTLLDVINWSDGIHNFNQCILGDKMCGADFECDVHRKCCKLRMDIADFFGNMTISDYSDIGTEALAEANR
jgi:Rrf2 family protein